MCTVASTELVTTGVISSENTGSPLPVYVLDEVDQFAIVLTPSKWPANNLLWGTVKWIILVLATSCVNVTELVVDSVLLH